MMLCFSGCCWMAFCFFCCVSKKPLRIVADKERVAIQLDYQSGIGIVDGQLVFGALLVQEVQAFVEGDAVEPRGKLGISPEIVQVGPGLDERVLQQVVGIVE